MAKQTNARVNTWTQTKILKNIFSLACECNQKAKEQGLKYFSIRYWAECYGGKDLVALERMVKDGYGASTKCANVEFQDCTDHSGGTECAGKAFAEYMYLIPDNTEGMLSY